MLRRSYWQISQSLMKLYTLSSGIAHLAEYGTDRITMAESLWDTVSNVVTLLHFLYSCVMILVMFCAEPIWVLTKYCWWTASSYDNPVHVIKLYKDAYTHIYIYWRLADKGWMFYTHTIHYLFIHSQTIQLSWSYWKLIRISRKMNFCNEWCACGVIEMSLLIAENEINHKNICYKVAIA